MEFPAKFFSVESKGNMSFEAKKYITYVRNLNGCLFLFAENPAGNRKLCNS